MPAKKTTAVAKPAETKAAEAPVKPVHAVEESSDEENPSSMSKKAIQNRRRKERKREEAARAAEELAAAESKRAAATERLTKLYDFSKTEEYLTRSKFLSSISDELSKISAPSEANIRKLENFVRRVPEDGGELTRSYGALKNVSDPVALLLDVEEMRATNEPKEDIAWIEEELVTAMHQTAAKAFRQSLAEIVERARGILSEMSQQTASLTADKALSDLRARIMRVKGVHSLEGPCASQLVELRDDVASVFASAEQACVAFVRNFKQTHGVDIEKGVHLRERSNRAALASTYTVHGLEQELPAAVRALGALDFSGSRDLEIPAGLGLGSIIGRSGANVREASEKHKVIIIVSRADVAPRVQVLGSPASVEAACAALKTAALASALIRHEFDLAGPRGHALASSGLPTKLREQHQLDQLQLLVRDWRNSAGVTRVVMRGRPDAVQAVTAALESAPVETRLVAGTPAQMALFTNKKAERENAARLLGALQSVRDEFKSKAAIFSTPEGFLIATTDTKVLPAIATELEGILAKSDETAARINKLRDVLRAIPPVLLHDLETRFNVSINIVGAKPGVDTQATLLIRGASAAVEAALPEITATVAEFDHQVVVPDVPSAVIGQLLKERAELLQELELANKVCAQVIRKNGENARGEPADIRFCGSAAGIAAAADTVRRMASAHADVTRATVRFEPGEYRVLRSQIRTIASMVQRADLSEEKNSLFLTGPSAGVQRATALAERLLQEHREPQNVEPVAEEKPKAKPAVEKGPAKTFPALGGAAGVQQPAAFWGPAADATN